MVTLRSDLRYYFYTCSPAAPSVHSGQKLHTKILALQLQNGKWCGSSSDTGYANRIDGLQLGDLDLGGNWECSASLKVESMTTSSLCCKSALSTFAYAAL